MTNCINIIIIFIRSLHAELIFRKHHSTQRNLTSKLLKINKEQFDNVVHLYYIPQIEDQDEAEIEEIEIFGFRDRGMIFQKSSC